MRNIILLIVTTMGLSILNSCHPDKVIQKTDTDTNADIDSVFFYKQKDVEDPLIDAVLDTNDHSSVVLKKELVPKVPGKPDYKLIEGYRVQIFASLDSTNALVTRYKAQQQVNQPVYLVSDGNMFKVQVGDFPYQEPAYKLRDEMDRNGFKGAWVVQREIRIPIGAENKIQPAAATETIDNTNTNYQASDGKYKIQVAAVSDEMRAQQLSYELQNQFQLNASYKLVGSIYKVYLGNFNDRENADSMLQKVRSSGYPDAWLVY